MPYWDEHSVWRVSFNHDELLMLVGGWPVVIHASRLKAKARRALLFDY